MPDGCDIEVVIEFDAGPTGHLPSYSEGNSSATCNSPAGQMLR
jgi:hypothetical protein